MSWDKGVVMECTGEDRWTLTLRESARPVVFKFLRNDEVWSTGEDYTGQPNKHHLPGVLSRPLDPPQALAKPGGRSGRG